MAGTMQGKTTATTQGFSNATGRQVPLQGTPFPTVIESQYKTGTFFSDRGWNVRGSGENRANALKAAIIKRKKKVQPY